MSGQDDKGLYQFADAAFNQAAAVAGPVLDRKLAERGVAIETLPQTEQLELLKSSLAEATAGQALDADQNRLQLILHALTDRRFIGAVGRLRAARCGSAFDLAQGKDAAIVLAGAGLMVVPMDKRTGEVIGPRASGIDEADAVFSNAKTAWVGYAPAEARFYTLVTDCLRTLF